MWKNTFSLWGESVNLAELGELSTGFPVSNISNVLTLIYEYSSVFMR